MKNYNRDFESVFSLIGKACKVRGSDKVCTISALHIYANSHGVQGVRVSVCEYREYAIPQWHNIKCVDII